MKNKLEELRLFIKARLSKDSRCLINELTERDLLFYINNMGFLYFYIDGEVVEVDIHSGYIFNYGIYTIDYLFNGLLKSIYLYKQQRHIKFIYIDFQISKIFGFEK